jgi:hypothetical protein
MLVNRKCALTLDSNSWRMGAIFSIPERPSLFPCNSDWPLNVKHLV